NRFLVFFPVGNIVARLQDGRGSSALIPPQRPSARYDQLGSVSSRAPEFTLPTSSLQQFLNDIVKRDRINRLQKLMGYFPDRFFNRPSVQLLSPQIPIADDEIHITDED